MTKYAASPTNREVFFAENEIIVSKTDPTGRLTYCNDVFLNIAGYTEREVLGQPHSVIRHPDMPRCVFKLLWDAIQDRREIFAYVKNMAKSGDHYWVLAHVTPSLDEAGRIIGFHSNRRVPKRPAVEAATDLYRKLKAVEDGPANRKDGLAASDAMLTEMLAAKGVSYDAFVLSL